MEEAFSLFEEYNSCITGEAPPCACACPLDVDIREFIEKITIGKYSAAYKELAKKTVFPGITCHICDEPCAKACVRSETDQPVAVRDLEKFCYQHQRTQPRTHYRIPQKKYKVLVIGGGPTGLNCAVKMAQRGYQVVLLEKTDRLGGRLLELPPSLLPPQVLQEELEALAELQYLEIHYNSTLSDLSEYTYDVALVATGANGDTYGAQESENGLFLKDGVFFAGSILNPEQKPLLSVRQGVEMSYLLESYLQTGRMDELPEIDSKCLFRPETKDIARVHKDASLQSGDKWTEADAQKESGRCLLCSCNNCADVCEMLTYFRKSPKKTIQDISDTVHKTVLTKKKGMRQVISCTLCGRCESVCPVKIDFKKICIDSRREMHRLGQLPEALYDYWLNDMDFANGEESSLLLPAPGNESPRYLFFPGCQMGASDPGYVTASYEWLLAQFPGELAVFLGCCGAPAFWAMDEERHNRVLDQLRKIWLELGKPTVILPCPSCMEMFTKNLPEFESISLWEVMAESYTGSPETKKEIISIFDPCASKYHQKAQKSVRLLAERAGYTIEELPEQLEEARCCGYGGLIYSINPGLTTKIVETNLSLGDREFVTYCSNCRETFQTQDKPSRHILDLLLFEGEDRYARPAPDLTERRENRRLLKANLMKTYLHKEYHRKVEPYQTITLQVPAKIRQLMDSLLIHEDNLKKVIYQAEMENNKIYNPADGSYSAHQKQSLITYWVTYKVLGRDNFELINVYKHNMSIEE